MSSILSPVLAVAGIEKRFPGVRALAGVSFDVQRGEIHGLVGENGAGKSTLMRVLAGVYQPDAGRILLGDEHVKLRGPRDAQDRGIAMVYQDTRLVPDLDVAQNIWLGREPGGLLYVDRRAMEREATRLLGRLALSIRLDRPVRELAFDERQLVEIARALTTDPAVLILDEPTSGLDAAEAERLLVLLRELRSAGTAIIFISHRLPEVLALSDRITVLKDGEVVATVAARAMDEDRLVAMMVGRSVAVAYPPRAPQIGQVRLDAEIADPSGQRRFAAIRLRVHAGEIVGLGGIAGNGQVEIVRSLFGLLPHSGTIKLDGVPAQLTSPRRAIAAGLVYVPGDRRREGLFLPHSIRENISVPHLARWSRLSVVSVSQERQAVTAAIREFMIRTPSPEQRVSLLSGGNQQKVVLGRWTRGAPRIYVLEEPTQGVDVATKLDLYRRIRGLAADGAAVLLVSSELLELIGLSDRIYVVSRGRIVDEVPAEDATEERIIGSAVRGPGAPEVAGHPQTPEAPRRRAYALGSRYGSAALLVVLILLIAAFTSSQSPYFLGANNLGDLALQITPLAFAGLGQLAVILLGGVDLTVGPTISLVTAISSYLIVDGAPFGAVTGIAACLAAGLAVGITNALLILRLRIPDLIATLATFSVVTGVALTVRPSPGGELSSGFMDSLAAQVGPVPLAAIAMLAIYVVAETLLVRGRVGARLYAVGSSYDAAFVVGIPVRMVRAGAYVFCSLCSVFAGLLVAARIGSGDPQAGAQFTLTSITAVVIGGASVMGGRGTAVGTLAGAVLVGLMQNALNYLHVSAYYQYVWTGLLTLVAVAAFSLGSRDERS